MPLGFLSVQNTTICDHFTLDFLPCGYVSTEHVIVAVLSLTHCLASSSNTPLLYQETHLSSFHYLLSNHLLSLLHLLLAFIFMSASNHLFNLCYVSSIPPPLHVPFNYRTPYYSFDRLSISSICPDYSLKIKKIAMDQSK